MLAFDATYITATLAQATMHGKRGLVGGKWTPEENNAATQTAFVDLEDHERLSKLDLRTIPRAPLMYEFLVWDPCALRKCPLSAASMPFPHGFGGVGSGALGNWQMLQSVGLFMKEFATLIKCVVFDAFGSHNYIRKLLHGQHEDIDEEALKEVPYFGQIKYMPMPKNCLPRLPLQLAAYEDDIVWGMVGPCSLT